MHMADALLAPAVAGVMYVCSAGAAAYSVKKIRLEDDGKKTPAMGVMGAFVFAAQMINFTIPGTGSSGHLCGGMLLSSILGPEAGFLTMIGVLMVQCLLFADGGLLALGANIWNMAFYGCFIGGMVIWKHMTSRKISKKRIAAASILGSVLSLQLGAFSVTLETLASGVTELPFTAFLAVMQPIHLLIGCVEGAITAVVLIFIYEVRPELLWNYNKADNKRGFLSYRQTIIIFAAAAAVFGGLISLMASANPDGLEWSMEQVAGTAELKAEGGFYALAAKIQSLTSFFPDYAWKNSESVTGTAFSGVLGGVVVIAVCVGICYVLKYFHKKKAKGQEGNSIMPKK